MVRSEDRTANPQEPYKHARLDSELSAQYSQNLLVDLYGPGADYLGASRVARAPVAE